MKECMKEKALKICINIYNRYSESELSMVPKIMHSAWLIGKQAIEDNTQNKLFQCPYNISTMCSMDELCNGCETCTMHYL